MKRKMTHDRTNPKEVHAAILECFPGTSAKDWLPEIIFAFIPEGACPNHWSKVLRNVEHNANKPPKQKKRRRAGSDIRKGTSYGALVMSKTEVPK